MFLSVTLSFFRYIDRVESARRRELKFQATHDPLTGLPNRNYLIERFPHWLKSETAFSLFFVDLDSIKGINDNFGHSVGEKATTSGKAASNTPCMAQRNVAKSI